MAWEMGRDPGPETLLRISMPLELHGKRKDLSVQTRSPPLKRKISEVQEESKDDREAETKTKVP